MPTTLRNSGNRRANGKTPPRRLIDRHNPGHRPNRRGSAADIAEYRISRQPRAVARSVRVADVALRFGLTPESEPVRVVNGLRLGFPPGSITLVTGPSGSGKSALLSAVARAVPAGRWVEKVRFPVGRGVVDAVDVRGSVADALSILTACGLGEPKLWLRTYRDLSEGEQFRARLARAVGLQLAAGRNGGQRSEEEDGGYVGVVGAGMLLCDEFCAGLHRRAGQAVSFNLSKLARRRGLAMVLATTRDELAADLHPDRIVRLDGHGGAMVIRPRPASPQPRATLSFLHNLVIERGRKRDYAAFAPMHYRGGDELGFTDQIFLLRDGSAGDVLGIVVYAYAPVELSLRNEITGGRYVRNARRLNAEVRIIRRLVVHPDVRGCGLGHHLVARTLRQVDVPVVECLAAMGEVNPVFEKAGMRRIGVCRLPVIMESVLGRLRELGADPMAEDFAVQVSRRPAVRRLVLRGVWEWVRSTTGGREKRIGGLRPTVLARTFRQLAGSRPVYYLWRRDESGANPANRPTEAPAPTRWAETAGDTKPILYPPNGVAIGDGEFRSDAAPPSGGTVVCGKADR